MIHVLWIAYVRAVAPCFCIFMGGVAIRRLRRDRTMGLFNRAVFTFNAIVMPILGTLALGASIYEAAA